MRATVPVGVTTLAGYGASAVSALAFVLVLLLHVDQEQAALIATAAVSTIALAVTQVGRYVQAKALIDASAHQATAVPVEPPVVAP